MNASLKAAKRSFGIAIQRITARPANVDRIDQIIGIGIARDYICWADKLQNITYSGKPESTSPKKPIVLEGTRFTYLWTATNALFSHPGLYHLMGGTMPKRELDRFRRLMIFAGTPSAALAPAQARLIAILETEVHLKEAIPNVIRQDMSVWEMIYYKYTTAAEQKRGIGKYMQQRLVDGTPFDPDLAQLVYGSRNWHFHGVLIASSLRGPPARAHIYYQSLNEILAKIHEAFGAKLLLVT